MFCSIWKKCCGWIKAKTSILSKIFIGQAKSCRGYVCHWSLCLEILNGDEFKIRNSWKRIIFSFFESTLLGQRKMDGVGITNRKVTYESKNGICKWKATAKIIFQTQTQKCKLDGENWVKVCCTSFYIHSSVRFESILFSCPVDLLCLKKEQKLTTPHHRVDCDDYSFICTKSLMKFDATSLAVYC